MEKQKRTRRKKNGFINDLCARWNKLTKQQKIIIVCGVLGVLAYLGHCRDQRLMQQGEPKEAFFGEPKELKNKFPGCLESKQRHGKTKCVKCDEGFRLRRGKCVAHRK